MLHLRFIAPMQLIHPMSNQSTCLVWISGSTGIMYVHVFALFAIKDYFVYS